MTSRYNNNSIYARLGLLFEYGQWMIGRFFRGYRPWVTLYRGVNDPSDHDVLE